MRYEILINKVLVSPLEKALELVKEYQKNIGFKNFAEEQKIADLLALKTTLRSRIDIEELRRALFNFMIMSRDNSYLGKAAFENIKPYPTIFWIECLGEMEGQDIYSLLKNYAKELPFVLIQICISNLPDKMQTKAIKDFKNYINPNEEIIDNLFFSLCEPARKELEELFPEHIKDTLLLELYDLEEKDLLKKLSTDKERIMKIPSDVIIELILLKSHNNNTINKFLELYSDKVMGCKDSLFELLFTRYKFLSNPINRFYDDEEDEINVEMISDIELFKLFKNKFYQFGLEKTLSLFNNRVTYDINSLSVEVILEFIDNAYIDADISKYINDKTIIEIIKRFVDKCNDKEYSLEDFELLVKNIDKDGKTKLIHDNYIEAIIACGKLLKNNIINNQHPLFLELREKFSKDIINRCKKDDTYLEDISLNGVFYRLAKGSIPFDKVYTTKTYKGLIYLTKAGRIIDNADYITRFFTDEQLAKLNINPVIRWKNVLNRTNTNADSLSFNERMGIQLLCYFGKDRAKYLLESNMPGNRMEHLFDGLDYKSISIDSKGNSIVNEELINFLFGRGIMKETNSVINRMIRGEIPEFERYFTTFCNSFEEIKKIFNGILSVKRIVNHFINIDLPIHFKPDEVKFKRALIEMNTTNKELLSEAIELLKDARNREYSTIPKVKGSLGDFSYEVLDLDNPLAIAVGYLSHCCFVVKGISYSSLKHSMQSINGRTFVVYYKGVFLTQSWIWRDGDVICFDSVEAGCPVHGMKNDDIKLVDVYKEAAKEMIDISQNIEDDIQKVKLITVGKSDYTFNNLERIERNVPRPLEENVYVYDSSVQYVLAGSMPENPRYGVVGVKYKDPRKKVITIDNTRNADIDLIDDATININSLRYQSTGIEKPINFNEYKKIIYGGDWYILIRNDGLTESNIIKKDEDSLKEYNSYLSKYNLLEEESNDMGSFAQKLTPSNRIR